MLFSKAIIALSTLASYASAQSPTGDAAAPEGSVKVHVVKALVSGGKPVFEPEVIRAEIGELIQFQFYPVNHSVVRAAFDAPCVPIEDTEFANGTTGFYSGFMPVSPDSTMMPTFTIAVEDAKPIWFYCSQGRHCQSGMVGVVNPPNNPARTIETFKQAAADAPANLSPGQEDVGGGAVPTNSDGGYAPPTPTTLETTRTGGSPTGTSTDIIATGAASKYGSAGMPMLLAAVAGSFFLL